MANQVYYNQYFADSLVKYSKHLTYMQSILRIWLPWKQTRPALPNCPAQRRLPSAQRSPTLNCQRAHSPSPTGRRRSKPMLAQLGNLAHLVTNVYVTKVVWAKHVLAES